MGNCCSSKESNEAPLNLTGPGLPPQAIVNEINTNINTNISSLNNSINQNNPLNLGNNNINMNNPTVLGTSQNAFTNNINNTQISQQILNGTIKPNDYMLGSIYTNGNKRQRMYIVIQLPGREIEVTKLYEDNTLSDLEAQIVSMNSIFILRIIIPSMI